MRQVLFVGRDVVDLQDHVGPCTLCHMMPDSNATRERIDLSSAFEHDQLRCLYKQQAAGLEQCVSACFVHWSTCRFRQHNVCADKFERKQNFLDLQRELGGPNCCSLELARWI